jgi:hypothetical protein
LERVDRRNGIFGEMDAPEKSKIGNSKIYILRFDPAYFEFNMYNASKRRRKPLKASEWSKKYNLQVVFNAGMYDMDNGLIHRGYSKNGRYYNNRRFQPGYYSMLAFQPVDSLKSEFDIHDLECTSWKEIKNEYRCLAQGMRMIDCSGEALDWNKKKQSCSMLVAAKDPKGRIYLIFSRSPYTHNQMIGFMQEMPYELSHAIYLEGGPETSLYINMDGHTFNGIGSYVSNSFPTDANTDFWPIPNVIGIRKKDQSISK